MAGNSEFKGEEKKEKVPRLSFYLAIYVFLCLSVYVTIRTIESIPSRNSTEKPKTSFNEGGEKCFDKDSLWFKLYQLSKQQVSNKNIKDVFELGGTTPKNILSFDDFHSNIIWKPQIARRNDSKHYDSSFNEVVYFHFDCLLGIQRTPPAISFTLPFNPFFLSLSDQSKSNYNEREIDWEIWRSSGEVPGSPFLYYS